MIQRIQSIFFLLSALCFGGEFTTSFASTDRVVSGIFDDKLYNIADHVGLQVLVGLGVLLSLVAIFLYKNRPNQIKLGYLIATLAIILPIVAVLFYLNETKDAPDFIIYDQMGLYLPIGMIISSLLAVRYIKKDEKLVQSMDRLR